MNRLRGPERIVVIGAGFGGLAAAIRLAGYGYAVTVLDKEAAPGGKARHVRVGEAAIDGGPTVFTMKWVFDRLLAGRGIRLEDTVALTTADLLARHAWPDGSRLDLHADIARSARAIAAFSDAANADGYLRFCADSRGIFDILKEPFIAGQRPNMARFLARLGPLSIRRHLMLRPFTALWPALARYFTDPRLRQLFARYATYVGSSPFATPATLMLVAHVEQDGVWMVKDGMHGLARGLMRIGERLGVRYRFGAGVAEILTDGGRAAGVRLADGETIPAAAVIYNGDVSALAAGHLGMAGRRLGLRPVEPRARSLSAMAFTGLVKTPDFPLAHHTVFFGDDYRDEFSAIFERRTVTDAPTVYVCAQDRASDGTLNDAARAAGRERVLMLVNAPADGDAHDYGPDEVEQWLTRTCRQMARCGLAPDRQSMRMTATAPDGFNALFPGSGGALYGAASHGWMASFKRPGAATRLPGLYLAGGSVHPGPGVPMATLSGLLAAERCLADRVSMPPFRLADISGGTSTG